MIKVSPLRDVDKGEFTELFKDYYRELGCLDDVPHLVEEYIIPDLTAGLLKTDILKDGEIFAGFIIYQVDDIGNDWNFKEGWGDVREIYVIPSKRRKGLGKFLLYTAEMKLKESGTSRAYVLPSENSLPFFGSCGYKKTDGYCAELDCPVYEKTDLNNCECGGKL